MGPVRGRRRATRFRFRTIRSSPVDKLARFDAQTIAERVEELDLDEEERDVLSAELESLAHGHLDDAGAVAVLRWHALSGGSLALTQQTGGRITLPGRDAEPRAGDRRQKAPYETRLSTPVAAVSQGDGRVEVHTRAGETIPAQRVVVAVPLNALGGIEFDPPLSETKRAAIDLGQASRGVKIFIHARGRAGLHRTGSSPSTRSATSTPRSSTRTRRSS